MGASVSDERGGRKRGRWKGWKQACVMKGVEGSLGGGRGGSKRVRGRRLTIQVWKRIGDGKPVLNMPRTPCVTTVDSNKTVL